MATDSFEMIILFWIPSLFLPFFVMFILHYLNVVDNAFNAVKNAKKYIIYHYQTYMHKRLLE